MPHSLSKVATRSDVRENGPPPRPGKRAAPADTPSVERVAEAEHHHVDVGDAGVGLQRLGEQVPVLQRHPVRQPAGRVDGRVGQDLVLADPLADAPVRVEQVAEVGHVQADLAAVARTVLKTSWTKLTSIRLTIGRNTALRRAYSPRCSRRYGSFWMYCSNASACCCGVNVRALAPVPVVNCAKLISD